MKIGMRFVLALVFVILIVSLAANGYLYNSLSENNYLRKQIVELQSQVTSLESQTANLQSQLSSLQNNSTIISDLNGQILDLQTENKNLQNENDNLRATIRNLQNQSPTDTGTPYLVTALGATFTWSYSESARYGMLYYLYVEGTVTNTGTGTAYNCALKVTMNTTDGVSFTEYYRFNALAPGEIEIVDTHFYHDHLQSWTIIPEYTNNP